MLAISVKYHLVRRFLHLRLNKPKQMLLIHTRRVMNVSVDFSDVVEISMRHLLTVCYFLVLIEQIVQIEFAFKILQSTKCKTFARSIGRDSQDSIKVYVELANCGNAD